MSPAGFGRPWSPPAWPGSAPRRWSARSKRARCCSACTRGATTSPRFARRSHRLEPPRWIRRTGPRDECAQMVEAETFTVAVFQDVAWARRGVEALLVDGFGPSALTILAKESPEIESLCQDTFGAAPDRLELRGLGASLARGSLVGVL